MRAISADLHGCVIEAGWVGERTDPGDLYASTQMVAIALMGSCVAVVCWEDFQIAAAGVYEGGVTGILPARSFLTSIMALVRHSYLHAISTADALAVHATALGWGHGDQDFRLG